MKYYSILFMLLCAGISAQPRLLEQGSYGQDYDDKGPKIGKEVKIPPGKILVLYKDLNKKPKLGDFVVVRIIRNDKPVFVWGKVMAKNHYVYVVQADKHHGTFMTEYNMYKIVDAPANPEAADGSNLFVL